MSKLFLHKDMVKLYFQFLTREELIDTISILNSFCFQLLQDPFVWKYTSLSNLSSTHLWKILKHFPLLPKLQINAEVLFTYQTKKENDLQTLINCLNKWTELEFLKLENFLPQSLNLLFQNLSGKKKLKTLFINSRDGGNDYSRKKKTPVILNPCFVPNLETLNVIGCYNNTLYFSLKGLSLFTNLTELKLLNVDLKPEEVYEITEVKKLKVLSLTDEIKTLSSFTQEVFPIHKLTCLKRLILTHEGINYLSHFSSCSSLELSHLFLLSCPEEIDYSFLKGPSFRKLESLCLSRIELERSFFQEILVELKQLNKFQLKDFRFLEDAVEFFSSSSHSNTCIGVPSLTHLVLSNQTSFTHYDTIHSTRTFVEHLPFYFPNLQKLALEFLDLQAENFKNLSLFKHLKVVGLNKLVNMENKYDCLLPLCKQVDQITIHTKEKKEEENTDPSLTKLKEELKKNNKYFN